MTREEAITYFKRHIDLYCVTGICREAEEIAIKALEQESTTKNDLGVDTVSRILVQSTISKSIEYKENPYQLYKRIERLPSVTPQEPRWIPVSERLPKIADVYRVTRYYPNNVMNPKYLVDACAFDGSNNWYNDNRINQERAYADNVIAWQENPEPYKVGPQESEDV